MALDDAAFGAHPEYRQPASGGKFRSLTFPFRFAFRLFKRSIAGTLRTVGYHPVSSLVFVILVAAVVFLGYENQSGTRVRIGPPNGSISENSTLPPSPAAEDFIKGQMTFNAALMWQSFSDDLKKQLTQRGTNQQSLQRQLDQRKQQGSKVDQVQYVGGVQAPDGTRLYMYSLVIDAPNQQGAAENHYVLTVDQNDKIIKVE
ncbi:MAG TPA: hypothetical protein VK009_06470 [Chloroflexota bacterium]|nr:hypothetical protein [Chloroflexota bacterium]